MAKKKEKTTVREFISQNDIDELLETAFEEQAEAADELELELSDLSETPTDDGYPDGDDQRLISNDDIGALFNNAGARAASVDPASNDDIGRRVSQSDIDALLGGDPDAAASPATADNQLEDGTGGLISQSDIDALLSGEPDAAASPATADNQLEDDIGGLISQTDIDALLGGGAKKLPVVGGTFEPQERNEAGDVISQSDIDTLLRGALASEEEAGTPADGDFNASSVTQSDIDSLLNESPGVRSPEIAVPSSKPVILAEVPEMEETPIPAASVPSRPWYAGKAYRIGAMAAILLLISSSLFLMIPRAPDTVSKPVVLVFPIPKLQSQAVTTMETGDTNVALSGFLVLAPPDNGAVTCVAADLVLDLLDTATARKIKDNEGFVRNIIYGVINDALLSRDGSAVDQTKLTLAVQTALGHVVPKEMIRMVSFEKFEII